jgi:hypothetical protein
MTAKIDTRSWNKTVKHLNVSSKTLQKELVNNLHREGPRVESQIKGEASSRIQRRAATTVRVNPTSDGIDIQGGGGNGLAGTLFAGGEFGGRRRRKQVSAGRSPAGKRYPIIRRRTTMQFAPHLGNEGYFFWPNVREWLPKLEKMQTETVEKSVGG